jgi:multiple sugar transport system permease protein
MADRADAISIRPDVDEIKSQVPKLRQSLLGIRGIQFVRTTVSYFFLTLGALFMLFPVFWMLSAALKPDWQIFVHPIIWIPQHWHKVDAGDSVRVLNLYHTDDPETNVRVEVIELGSRRYTPVVTASAMPEVFSAPADEISEAVSREIGGIALSVRIWNGEEVVAVSRDGDNLLVVKAADLDEIEVMPLDVVNSGERENIQVGAFELQFRTVNGTQLFGLGPQTQLTTVTPSDVAQHAIVIPLERLGSADTLPLSNTEISQYTLVDDPEARYLVFEEADWQPAIDAEVLREHALTIPSEAFVPDDEPDIFNLGVFPVGSYADEAGNEQRVALILQESIQTQDTLLVLPVEYMDSVTMVPSASLQRPFPENIDGTAVRIKDFTLPYVNDETINMDRLPDRVGIVGQRQEMALIVPVEAVETAFDTLSDRVIRNTSVSLRWSNFADAMSREFADANFLTFFKNSIVIAGLNIIGHLFSCSVVAYAFARMRAPGKNILFMAVLATLMLPHFVTLVPVYMIFRDLGWIDTINPLWVKAFFGNAFLIFLMRQFFSTIPLELEDAARIDGASRVQTFVRIMIPLITPALATIVIFTFLWNWNDLFNAAIYLNSPSNYTVAIGLKQFVGQYESEFPLLMAAATVVMAPTVALFFFAQRFFIEGITLTGLKG